MRLEAIFEKFEQLADAPDAVAKLRQVVLHLATHGKLTKQVPDDEPAQELRDRIRNQLQHLRSRHESRWSPVEPCDLQGLPPIPTSWRWVCLGNVVDYGSPDRSESVDIPDDAWLLDLEDIEKDTSRLLQRKSFRDRPSKSTKTAFAAGDVLYGKLRPYLNKVLVADGPGYCTTEIIPIRAFGLIEPAYLCMALKRPESITYANSKSYGMNLPRLGTEDARRAPFPLPPLAEQKRIVAKVDELMALCDRLEAQQQERQTWQAVLARASLARLADAPTPANLSFLFHDAYTIEPTDLRKSILTLAFQGALTDCDESTRTKDDAKTVLRSASTDRRRFWDDRPGAKRYPEPADYGSANLPRIQNHWLWASLDSICAQITDGEHIQPPYQAEGVPMLSAKHVRDGYVTLDGAGLISEEAFERSIARCQPENGDILIVSVGATTGRSAIVAECPRFAIVRSVLLLKPVIMKEYLHWWLKNPWAFEWMTQASAASAQPHLYIRDLKHMPVPIAPLAEQRQIVATVGRLMASVDLLGTRLAASRITATNLFDALVAQLDTLA